jgi:hypothetical protein
VCGCFDEICCNFFHLCQRILKVHPQSLHFGAILQILLELGIGDLIIILKLAILFSLLLDGIVGEVDELVLEVLQAELLAGCADVALLVPVPLYHSVDCRQQDVAAKVEFTLVVKERVLEIFLDYYCSFVYASLADESFYLWQRGEDCDAVAAVRVLPRFADPNIVAAFLALSCKTLKVFCKSEELGIVEAGSDVEGKRED